MSQPHRNTLFVALTRPQMFAGVTYNYFVINVIVAAELFLIFRTLWVLAASALIHLVGVLICLHEPRAVDLWLTRSMRCPHIKNFKLWRCNSYRA